MARYPDEVWLYPASEEELWDVDHREDLEKNAGEETRDGSRTEEAADIINQTKANGGRVIAVGTTSIRTLESAAKEDGTISPIAEETGIFIYPDYKFKIVDSIITNFHLPKSTLIMLISAFAGREYVLSAYEQAVKEKYRFFSFGDAMFIE